MGLRVTFDPRGGAAAYRELVAAVAQRVYEFAQRVAPVVREQAGELVEVSLRESPEWSSLMGRTPVPGDPHLRTLREHFGLENPEPALEGVARAVRESLRATPLEPRPAAGDLGGMRIEVLREDFEDALSAAGTSYVSQGKHGSFLIPWLSWLLLAGEGVILAESEINTAKPRPSSRTGRAVMVKPTRRPPHGWRVPPPFSGTPDNNWLTRALEPRAEDLARLTLDEFRKL